jgi:tripartite-type tricarboxylate transporter receptor subunit TctC
MKKFGLLAGVATLAFGAIATPVLADYPQKPVTFIVPWPPGDLEDVLTRLIAEEFQTELGAPAAVVNMPGGGGVVGGVKVATSKPDGYTIGSFVVDIPTIKTMGAEAQIASDALEPVGIFLTYPFLIAAKKDAPYHSMAELAEYSKQHDVRLGHFGYGLPPTLLTFSAMGMLGGKFSGEAAFDSVDCSTLANGDADVVNTTAQQVLSCMDDITILATVTGERTAVTPDVPTLAEISPDLNLSLWNGLFVPKGTPQEVKDKIAAVAQKMIASDAAKEIAKTTGALIYWQGQDDAVKQIAADQVKLVAIREALGVTD